MANNPIQIVLNSNNFIGDFDKPPGGTIKDFYEGRDSAFALHKQEIENQLISINNSVINNEFSETSYVKLTLNQSALSKSSRPTKVLFRRDIAPVVGGGDIGELYVEVSPKSIGYLTDKIQTAEDKVANKLKKGKQIPSPTRLRSEVGAIERIQAYSTSDKRSFSISQGLEWLSNIKTGGSYIVELFEFPPARQHWDLIAEGKRKLFSSFESGLQQLGIGVVASRLMGTGSKVTMLTIRLNGSLKTGRVNLSTTFSSTNLILNDILTVDLDPLKHEILISFLERHPLVKKIDLPPVISSSYDLIQGSPMGKKYKIPSPNKKQTYPIVGIIDGGLSSIFSEWVSGAHEYIHQDDREISHATFIGGLLVSGNEINGPEVCKEVDGCNLVDMILLPQEDKFNDYYIDSPLEFFNELRIAVGAIKERTGVRIFNFSLNTQEHVSSSGYSVAAKYLDTIAFEHDVIFIISAGNTNMIDVRSEWPKNSIDALSILATCRNHILKSPAESCRNISVSAVNPPNLKGVIPFAPANYSCHGPGLRIGIKPDLSHIGGAGSDDDSGLYSLDRNGEVIHGCGTSYATIHIAKALALLDQSIEGYTSRETLIALMLHHSEVPDCLRDKKLQKVLKNVIGFGIPKSSVEILEGTRSGITLVFANRITAGKRMRFNFSWPTSLVRDGSCSGWAKLTLVSTPPFDYVYGAEFVRVNMQAQLRQEEIDNDGKSSYTGRLEPIYAADKGNIHLKEKNLIANAFKWAPTKMFAKNLKEVGKSSNWTLDIECLTRDGEIMPVDGVPFTALLTIEDLSGKKPVFQEMRQSLQSTGVVISDIQTASRVTPRV